MACLMATGESGSPSGQSHELQAKITGSSGLCRSVKLQVVNVGSRYVFLPKRQLRGLRIPIRRKLSDRPQSKESLGDVSRASNRGKEAFAAAIIATRSKILEPGTAHPELVCLFHGVPFLDRVTTWTDGAGLRMHDWDQQIEVMELPRAFRTTIATIPSETPYLWVDPRWCKQPAGSWSQAGAAHRAVVGRR
jgi:hypothetical protein